MPECHRCEWNQRGPSPEKKAACGSCHMAEDYTNHKGKIFVSIDAGESSQTKFEVEASMQNAREKAEEDAASKPMLPDCCMETAWRMLDYLSQLDERELKLLVEVSHGATLAEVARRGALSRRGRRTGRGGEKMTRANVSRIWREITNRLPELAGVLETTNSAQLRKAGGQ